MTKLWAVYGMVDHRVGQVLVLTPLANDAPAATDDPIKDVEWNYAGPKAEARGSTPDPS
jgi:hypothetical protein